MISDGVLMMFILLVIRECMDCLYETINYWTTKTVDYSNSLGSVVVDESVNQLFVFVCTL